MKIKSKIQISKLKMTIQNSKLINLSACHCEERSDEAIPLNEFWFF